jgi:hypothetical protein
MTKHELIYVLVRFTGVLLLGLAFSSFLGFLGVLSIKATSPMMTNTGSVVPLGIAQIIIPGVVGAYLIRDGKLLADILDRPGDQ